MPLTRPLSQMDPDLLQVHQSDLSPGHQFHLHKILFEMLVPSKKSTILWKLERRRSPVPNGRPDWSRVRDARTLVPKGLKEWNRIWHHLEGFHGHSASSSWVEHHWEKVFIVTKEPNGRLPGGVSFPPSLIHKASGSHTMITHDLVDWFHSCLRPATPTKSLPLLGSWKPFVPTVR